MLITLNSVTQARVVVVVVLAAAQLQLKQMVTSPKRLLPLPSGARQAARQLVALTPSLHRQARLIRIRVPLSTVNGRDATVRLTR